MVVETPLYPIQEAIICQKYFPASANDASVDPRCKTEIVQAELSFLKGWQLTISLLPGMLTALPYGMMAENIIGGGVYVNAAMMYTIAADFSTGPERAIGLVGKLVGSPLTYAAMSHGNWFAVYIGMGFLSAATLATFSLPSTDSIRPMQSSDEDNSSDPDKSSPDLHKDFFDSVKKTIALIRIMFWENKQLGLLLSTFLFTSLGKSVPTILMQYMTKRFQWTWAEMFVVTLALPFISQVLTRNLGLTSISKDLWLARAGLICLTVGMFGMGLANTSVVLIISLVLCSLGFGSDPAMRGLLVTMGEGQPTSLLFTTMSVLECLGLLISGPLLATTFKIGMEWEGAWIGLPFISAGWCLACATFITIGVRVREKPSQGLDGLI
ncbi:MFS transporter [Penicillium longicatenatum]|nr:MFS transporter [Penicillium longicatenatum]